MRSARSSCDEDEGCPGIPRHQLAAAAAPQTSLRDLAELPPDRDAKDDARAAGNFNDLQALLDELAGAAIFELGNPVPSNKHLPKRRVGSCPASHNRALLDPRQR